MVFFREFAALPVRHLEAPGLLADRAGHGSVYQFAATRRVAAGGDPRPLRTATGQFGTAHECSWLRGEERGGWEHQPCLFYRVQG